MSISSIDQTNTIYDMVEAGAYPPDATTAFKAFMANPATEYRGTRSYANTIYKPFKAMEATRRSFVAEAVAQIAATGPVCSTEGSYQHHGECWNDAVHMLFLYADGLKERTQPALLTGDLTEMARTLNDGTAEGALRAKHMRVYLEATQSRFARQALNQADNDALCRRDIAEAIRSGYGSRRAAGKNAMVAAIMGAPRRAGVGTNRPFEISMEDYVAGYFSNHISKELINVFGLSGIIQQTDHAFNAFSLAQIDEPVDSIAGILISSQKGNKRIGHATCMYSCNGVDYFFDDNLGVFQYPWRRLLGLPNSNLIIVNLKIGDVKAYSYWPACYLPDRNKLIVPSTMTTGPRFFTLNWSGDTNTAKTWSVGTTKVTYIPHSHVSFLTVLSFIRPQTAVQKVAPAIVGRGPFRGIYRSPNSSSERRALEGPRYLADENIPANKAEMDVVQAATKSSPIQIIRSFDLTFCQNWYDGDELWSMDRDAVYKRAPGTLEDSYVPIYLSGNAVTRKRILKYMKRGFRVQYDDPNTGATVEITQANLANVNTAP